MHRDFRQANERLSFRDAVPGEKGNGIGESAEAARRFAAIGMGIENVGGVTMQHAARADVHNDQGESNERAVAATRCFVFCADFRTDQAEKFRQ